jgi:hypothetical protein
VITVRVVLIRVAELHYLDSAPALESSVSDPWDFGPDPDPRIRSPKITDPDPFPTIVSQV